MTEFTPPQGGEGFVSFAGNVPGKIFTLDINGNEFIAQKDAFLCSEPGIDLDIAFTKRLRSGAFGGEGGFILQRLSGSGKAFLHCCGDIMEMTLAPGEVVRVETGARRRVREHRRLQHSARRRREDRLLRRRRTLPGHADRAGQGRHAVDGCRETRLLPDTLPPPHPELVGIVNTTPPLQKGGPSHPSSASPPAEVT